MEATGEKKPPRWAVLVDGGQLLQSFCSESVALQIREFHSRGNRLNNLRFPLCCVWVYPVVDDDEKRCVCIGDQTSDVYQLVKHRAHRIGVGARGNYPLTIHKEVQFVGLPGHAQKRWAYSDAGVGLPRA